jgi:hypothetical protein
MPGDPTSSNDDELLSQIDELKARMDRLMSGGTSTSNSALLTGAAKAVPKKAEPALVEQPSDPAPHRTRVRDLIGPDDDEVVQPYTDVEPKGVPFPDEDGPGPVAKEPSRPESEPTPPPKTRPDRSAPIGGSVITVDDDYPEPRPQVASFDDLGSAIQEELAKDIPVPEAEHKKGPDLASRFGPADDPVVADEASEEAGVDEEPEEPVSAKEVELEVAEDEEDEYEEPVGRGRAGLVAAIWVGTALASGAIAALHFSGII